MWQDKYEPSRYQCPKCERNVLEDDYDWVEGRCKRCSYKEHDEEERKVRHQKALKRIDELLEKERKFDELQQCWLWLARRAMADGDTPSEDLRYFLTEISKHFEYKE